MTRFDLRSISVVTFALLPTLTLANPDVAAPPYRAGWVTRTSTPPKIDGLLVPSDGWTAAPAMDGFHLLRNGGPGAPTEVRLLHDDQALYVAARLHGPAGDSLKITARQRDDLAWADVVLYASSTVGLEAVSSGIPAVYLNLGHFLDTDPMSGWSDFRWSVKEPSELVKTVRCIRSLPKDRFEELQQKGREYVASYLSPATNGKMRAFWET